MCNFRFFKNPRIYYSNLDKKKYFDPKMASNPPVKSDFCHFFGRFLPFWSILVNLTKKIDLNPEKFKKYQCPKMVSNRLYGHYLRSYAIFGFSKTRVFTSVILTQKMYFDAKKLKKIRFYVCFQSSKMMIFKKNSRYTYVIL